MNNLGDLEKNLRVKFKNKDLLAQALVHKSYLNENPEVKVESNERLEFLGDAILSFLVAEKLFGKYHNLPEGELTNLRSLLVRTSTLARLAKRLKIGQFLQLSKGEAGEGGNNNPNILADSLEAIIGAIYLDSGMSSAKRFIQQQIFAHLPELTKDGNNHDFKGRLQIILQEKFHITPKYRILSEIGPDHAKDFEMGVYVGRKLLAKGIGKNHKEASQAAARTALRNLKSGLAKDI